MDNLPKHIQEQYNKARNIPYNSKEYWKLRCTCREKMDDPTYLDFERNHCRKIWKILLNKT